MFMALLPPQNTVFNIAGHYHQYWEEGPKEVFRSLCLDIKAVIY